MPTAITHTLVAFILLIFINRLFKFKIAEEYLFLFACAAILPDLLDKYLTGQRYVCHSLVFSIILFVIIGILIYKLTKEKQYVIYVFLIGVAFASHGLLDLTTGGVFLLWPLDPNGYYILIVDWVMIQTIHIPPLFDTFQIELVRSVAGFEIRYGSLGVFVSSLDFIVSFLLGLVVFSFCIKEIIKELRWRRQFNKAFDEALDKITTERK